MKNHLFNLKPVTKKLNLPGETGTKNPVSSIKTQDFYLSTCSLKPVTNKLRTNLIFSYILYITNIFWTEYEYNYSKQKRAAEINS